MPQIHRTLVLKRVVPVKTNQNPKPKALALHTALAGAFAKAATIWDRHYPRQDKIKPGKRCIFFREVPRPGKRALLFHAFSYVSGHTPDQAVFDAADATVSADPILTPAGQHKEIVERFAVIVIGETMIIESARVAGSALLAARAIRDIVRRSGDKTFPSLTLDDAPSLKFKQMAALHGGVKLVTARIAPGFVVQPKTFGNSLETCLQKAFGVADARLTATVEVGANDEIDADQVEALLDESEAQTGLSGITVQFHEGGSLSDLASYREKLSIEVQQVRPGVPAINEIETAMVDYLTKLVTPVKNWQLITDDGMFT